MGRSIGAVIAGYAVMAVLIMLGFGLMQLLMPGVFPTPPAFPEMRIALLIIVSGLVAAMAGGYVTASIARQNNLKHGIILGIVVIVMGIISVLINPVPQPLWYNASIILAGVIGVILGAIMRKEPVQQ